jgi:hypothetical protein
VNKDSPRRRGISGGKVWAGLETFSLDAVSPFPVPALGGHEI